MANQNQKWMHSVLQRQALIAARLTAAAPADGYRYARGLTPNPDLACNRAIKFDALLQHARGLGAGSLVTGHFARLRHLPGACK